MNASFMNAMPEPRMSRPGCFEAQHLDRLARRVRGLGDLGGLLAGQAERDVHGRGPAVAREEATAEERLRRCCRAHVREPRRIERARRARDELADHDVVAVVTLGLGVLEVRERVDARRVGQRPADGGQLLDGLERVLLEDVSLARLHHEEDVVGLRERALEVLEGVEPRVVLREEDAVVGGEPRHREPEGHEEERRETDEEGGLRTIHHGLADGATAALEHRCLGCCVVVHHGRPSSVKFDVAASPRIMT